MNSPNFLNIEHFIPLRKFSFSQLFRIALGTAIAVILWDVAPIAIVFGGGVALVIVLALKLDWGLYAMALFAFFHPWEINFGVYPRLREIPYLPNINAPIVDIIAALVFVALLVAVVWRIRHIDEQTLRGTVKIGKWYVLFLGIAAFSLTFFMYQTFYSFGIKFFLRSIIFSFTFFWLLPIFIIEKRKQWLTQVLNIWFWVGTGIALFGLSSLLMSPQAEWMRVVPYQLFGVAPLGYNHNQIAEVLVALVPIAFWLSHVSSKETKILYKIGGIIMIVAALLTLSRAAWITLAGEGLIAAFFLVRNKRQILSHMRGWIVGVAVSVPVLLYMAKFLGSSVVSSSTSARAAAVAVSLFTARASLWFGHGPGSYEAILADTLLYTKEYGAPLAAHGFLHKILLETGIVGFAAFALFFGMFFLYLLRAMKHNRELMLALFIMSFGAVAFQVFNTSYFNSVMWMPLGIAFAGAHFVSKSTA